MLCEAAGYDVVLIETVGIGQSEVSVASMVDFFAVLLLPAGGDELQGIKKGVIELADALVVNKADGPMRDAAERTRMDYAGALGLIRAGSEVWQPRAFCASALKGQGVQEVWKAVLEHHDLLTANGELHEKRRRQARSWMWNLVEEGLQTAFRRDEQVGKRIASLEREVGDFKTTPAAAARALLSLFLGDR